MKYCCVSNCPSSNFQKQSSRKLSMFLIPTDIKRRAEWYRALEPHLKDNPLGDWAEWNRRRCRFVCELHFNRDEITDCGLRRKVSRATPCIFSNYDFSPPKMKNRVLKKNPIRNVINKSAPASVLARHPRPPSSPGTSTSSDEVSYVTNLEQRIRSEFDRNHFNHGHKIVINDEIDVVLINNNAGKNATAPSRPLLKKRQSFPPRRLSYSPIRTTSKRFGTSYCCPECGLICSSSGGYRTHQKMHETLRHGAIKLYPDEKWAQCKYCAYQSKWRNNVKKHELLHIQSKNCKIPPRVQEHDDEMNPEMGNFDEPEHVYVIDDDEEESQQEYDEDENDEDDNDDDEDGYYIFQCASCPYKNIREESLKYHLAQRHYGHQQPPTKLTCPLCGQIFNQKEVFNMHRKCCGKSEATSSSSVIDLTEDGDEGDAGATFKITDVRTVDDEKVEEEDVDEEWAVNAMCEVSYGEDSSGGDQGQARDFTTPMGYYKVKVNATLEKNLKRYKCAECAYETLYSAKYRRHVLTHEAKRNPSLKVFRCPMCDYSTALKHNLKAHLQNKKNHHHLIAAK